MDVTPRELRDVEIREAFRGYNRDDVNDLLERAASTIEEAGERVRQLSERLASAQGDSQRTRETEDILHRTLLLAQRAADEAVAEAQARARQTVEEAEAQSRRMVSEAEAEARSRTEAERRRLDEELRDLAARRDTLLADVEALGRHEAEYRERLVRAIEGDLAALRGRGDLAPGPAPSVSEVPLPAEPEAMRPPPAAGDATRELSAVEAEARGFVGSAREASEGPDVPQVPEQPEVAVGPEDGFGTTPALLDLAAEEPAAASGPVDLLAGDDAVDADVLDDDAFFATLREAVRDDAPLGPRDGEAGVYDQDDTDSVRFRDVFKRRR